MPRILSFNSLMIGITTTTSTMMIDGDTGVADEDDVDDIFMLSEFHYPWFRSMPQTISYTPLKWHFHSSTVHPPHMPSSSLLYVFLQNHLPHQLDDQYHHRDLHE